MKWIYDDKDNGPIALCCRYGLRIAELPWSMRPLVHVLSQGEAALGAALLDRSDVVVVFKADRSWRLDLLHELAHYVIGGFEDERYVMTLQWIFLDQIAHPLQEIERRRMLREYTWDPERALMFKDALKDKRAIKQIDGAYRMMARRGVVRMEAGTWVPTFRLAPHVARARQEYAKAQKDLDLALSRTRI